jgi:hypothetical protein
MNELQQRKPILSRAPTGGVLITIYQFGSLARYVHDLVSRETQRVTTVYRSIEEAQNAADHHVQEVGHECSAGCESWAAVSSTVS